MKRGKSDLEVKRNNINKERCDLVTQRDGNSVVDTDAGEQWSG